jgi:pimeloyl-ACP methyl ester carboxylesterase
MDNYWFAANRSERVASNAGAGEVEKQSQSRVGLEAIAEVFVKLNLKSSTQILFTSIALLTFIAQTNFRSVHASNQDNCAELVTRLNGLKMSRTRLQAELQTATGTDRQSLVREIKELDAEIQEKQRLLNRCVVHYELRPSQTDPRINDPNRLHEVYVRADGFGDLLFMFFPGSPQQPSEFKEVLETAARAGYHAIGVDYPNQEGELRTICSNRPNCYGQLRREVLEGRDVSPDVAVNSDNCILNRAVKLLQWLDVNHPNENWGQFLNSGQIRWSKVTVAGHSQGGGHAAMIARLFEVRRVVMFSSVTDAVNGPSGFIPAPWLTQPRVTPDNRYYGFGNTEDNLFFPQIDINWKTLSLPGSKSDVDTSPPPYSGSHRLTTSNDLQHSGTPIHRHNLVVTDKDTPLDSNGDPVYLAVWRYLIGP